ncbi:hypothetical protein niasHS_004206 [Heterodera schachtii]|uniref:MATH domain-containing protein n=1 Tax=Heterodera schachtii TaxID=97005 RepID=A0ABD2JT78_HETSC
MFHFDSQNANAENDSDNCPADVEIPDVEAAAFKVMLSFIYTDDLSGLNGDNAMAVLYAAKKYNIPGLVDPSLQIPISELRNVFVAYFEARLFDLEDFANCCLSYIDKNADTLVKSEEFLQIDQKTLRNWSCKCSATIRIISQKNWAENSIGTLCDLIFCNKPTIWGWDFTPNNYGFVFVSFARLMDPSNGFYNREEDKVTLAIDVTVKEEKMDKFVWDLNKLKWTLSMDIENLSEFVREIGGSEHKGDTLYINGFAWEIVAQITTNEDTGNDEKWLGIYLLCNGPKEDKSWECKCSSTFRIVSQKSGVGDYKIRAHSRDQHTFYSFENSWGFSNFISFAQLMDPSNDFYNQNEDKVTLAIDFTVKDEIPDDVIRVWKFNDHLLRRSVSIEK